MSKDYIIIDYKEICKFYWSIYFSIVESVDNVKYGDIKDKTQKEIMEAINNEEGLIYGYLEKLSWRLGDVEELLEYSNEDEFFYYAMENFKEVSGRFESFLNETKWKYPQEVYDYNKYDDLIEYYNNVKIKDGTLRHTFWDYYNRLLHRKHYYVRVKKYEENITKDIDWLMTFINKSLQNKSYDYGIKKIHQDIVRLSFDINELKKEWKQTEDNEVILNG